MPGGTAAPRSYRRGAAVYGQRRERHRHDVFQLFILPGRSGTPNAGAAGDRPLARHVPVSHFLDDHGPACVEDRCRDEGARGAVRRVPYFDVFVLDEHHILDVPLGETRLGNEGRDDVVVAC